MNTITGDEQIDISSRLDSLVKAVRASSEEWANRWDAATTKEQAQPLCRYHPEQPVTIDRDASIAATAETRQSDGSWTLKVLVRCAQCDNERGMMTVDQRLRKWGVGESHARCSLKNWLTDTDNNAKALQVAKRFVEMRSGALIMVSPGLGNGKTHLGTAILRASAERGIIRGMYTTHTMFMRQLRAFYGGKATNPIDDGLRCGIVFFDEFGVSSGGADEEPALYDLIDGLYRGKRKLIIAGNFPTFDAFKAATSPRLFDRLREMTLQTTIVMTGPSRRGEDNVRAKYQQPYKD